jgi:Zn finger protein HypA/HybF involved in hydrogenase expression
MADKSDMWITCKSCGHDVYQIVRGHSMQVARIAVKYHRDGCKGKTE